MPVHQGGPGRAPIQRVDHAEQTDDRCGVDVGTGRLVVQADVAADNRRTEGLTGLGHPVDSLRELPHDLGVLRVSEVQAVHDGQRSGPDAGEVHDRLGHYLGRSPTGVDRTPAMVAVGGNG